MEKDTSKNIAESSPNSVQTDWDMLNKLAEEEPWDEHVAKAEQLQSEYYSATSSKEALEKIRNMEMSDKELWQIGEQWDEVTIDEEALQAAIEINPQPNVTNGQGLFFGKGRNLPMSGDAVYRHVGSSAIRDLLDVGFVRNKRMAAGAMQQGGVHFGTVGELVYWYPGKEGVNERADLVIEADKSRAEQGYVTKDAIRGIWVTNPESGEAVNLIAKSTP